MKKLVLCLFFVLIPLKSVADHNCNWVRSSGINILSNIYNGGNFGFVRDSLIQRGVEASIATKLVEFSAGTILPNSKREIADYCNKRKNAPSNNGLGAVFGTGPMDYNACVAEYGFTSFKKDLLSAMSKCEGTNNILANIGHSQKKSKPQKNTTNSSSQENTSSTSNNSKIPCDIGNLKACKDHHLCSKATLKQKGTRSWSKAKVRQPFVQEAYKRKLHCGVN